MSTAPSCQTQKLGRGWEKFVFVFYSCLHFLLENFLSYFSANCFPHFNHNLTGKETAWRVVQLVQRWNIWKYLNIWQGICLAECSICANIKYSKYLNICQGICLAGSPTYANIWLPRGNNRFGTHHFVQKKAFAQNLCSELGKLVALAELVDSAILSVTKWD